MTTILENVVLNRLENLKPGHVTTMWDRMVLRIGDKYNVSEIDGSCSIHRAPYTIEQAEQLLRTR